MAASGACLVSTDSYDAGRHVAFYAVALNLVGPVIQGIVVTLLRRSATREVAKQNTSYVEFTFVKLAFSTITAGVLALLIEGVADARSCVVALLGDAPRFLTTVGLISGVQLLFTVLATYNAASDTLASRRWRTICTPGLPHRHAIAATIHSQARVGNERRRRRHRQIIPSAPGLHDGRGLARPAAPDGWPRELSACAGLCAEACRASPRLPSRVLFV